MLSSSSSATPPNLPWLFHVFLRASSFIFNLAFRPDVTVNRRFLGFFDSKVPPSPVPVDSVSSHDITGIDSSGESDVWVRVYNPDSDSVKSGRKIPLVVFYHGGGFVFGTADSASIDSDGRNFAKEFCAVVVSVNYRLAPEHRFPSQYDDGFDVLKFIDDCVDTGALPENTDLSRCFLAGESAGGNLAHHVAVRATRHKFKTLKIVGLIAIQPFFGSEERTESEIRLAKNPGMGLDTADWYWKAFLPEGSDRNHPAANVFGPDSVGVEKLDFPATLVVIGGFDVLQDSDRKYSEWLKKSGKEVEMVEYPNALHGFLSFKNLPEYSLLINHIKLFIQKH